MNINHNHTQNGRHRRRRDELPELDQAARIARGRKAFAKLMAGFGIILLCLSIGIMFSWGWAFCIGGLIAVLTSLSIFGDDEQTGSKS